MTKVNAHYPPGPDGPGDRKPKATNPAETEFLLLGEGARLWLVEAAAAGTARVKTKMAEAVTMARLHGTEQVDWALGHAAAYGRFDEGDIESILATGATGEHRRASESHSLQPSTKAWEHFGGGGDR